MAATTGTLFLIPTVLAPGTAAEVLAPQVRDTIGRLDYFFAENLRTARRFISELKTGRAIDTLTFFELHKDTPERETAEQLQRLREAGHDAGVLSEAGCPGVADPGAKAVRLLEKEAQQRDQTQIFMETPYRNNALLEELLRTCGPNTPLCIASQLTAPDQFIRTLTVREWQRQPPDLHKKPTVFLLYRA
jgi:16S rRNA (cytidine1402-2'-O)-methyltransferase